MIRFTIRFVLFLICPAFLFAQVESSTISDSLHTTELKEIVVISQKALSDKADKPLTTLDNYLQKANAINMVRRGSYAWEPFINGMASERSVITIDGMRIYGACTDKMDPVTSYVETTNLSKASVHSGQSGPTGATIGGSLDLERKKSKFGREYFGGAAFMGYETNNQQKVIGTSLSRVGPELFADVDFTYRDAENYKAGGKEEVAFSQFTKFNVSGNLGVKLGEHRHLVATLIYDRATDVGYPALPMDVSVTQAFIGSAEYERHHITPALDQWQFKLYYNDVTHIMDDSHRPDVPVRMDMPGWSKTGGFYSLLEGTVGKHKWKANLSGHHNNSLAEMTMYSSSVGEKDMFMLTWPGVLTLYNDLFVQDKFKLSDLWTTNLSLGIAANRNTVDNEFGLESLKIFYPEMQKSTIRLLKRAAANFDYRSGQWKIDLGAAYGERAPSVSEGYGFYLFNSFDRYDYIGNPEMSNEKSASVNTSIAFVQNRLSTKWSANHFYIADYIIGMPQTQLSAMTIGAEGVKTYGQLKYAQIFNTSFELHYQFTEQLFWSNKMGYRYGTGHNIKYLPLIQPFTYGSSLAYFKEKFTLDFSVNGAGKQNRFNSDFGERKLPSYWVADLSASQVFIMKTKSITLKAGIENLLDKHYTTFADWNRLPRMGRNVFINVVFGF